MTAPGDAGLKKSQRGEWRLSFRASASTLCHKPWRSFPLETRTKIELKPAKLLKQFPFLAAPRRCDFALNPDGTTVLRCAGGED